MSITTLSARLGGLRRSALLVVMIACCLGEWGCAKGQRPFAVFKRYRLHYRGSRKPLDEVAILIFEHPCIDKNEKDNRWPGMYGTVSFDGDWPVFPLYRPRSVEGAWEHHLPPGQHRWTPATEKQMQHRKKISLLITFRVGKISGAGNKPAGILA